MLFLGSSATCRRPESCVSLAALEDEVRTYVNPGISQTLNCAVSWQFAGRAQMPTTGLYCKVSSDAGCSRGCSRDERAHSAGRMALQRGDVDARPKHAKIKACKDGQCHTHHALANERNFKRIESMPGACWLRVAQMFVLGHVHSAHGGHGSAVCSPIHRPLPGLSHSQQRMPRHLRCKCIDCCWERCRR
jgi:hypothetical protein